MKVKLTITEQRDNKVWGENQHIQRSTGACLALRESPESLPSLGRAKILELWRMCFHNLRETWNVINIYLKNKKAMRM